MVGHIVCVMVLVGGAGFSLGVDGEETDVLVGSTVVRTVAAGGDEVCVKVWVKEEEGCTDDQCMGE